MGYDSGVIQELKARLDLVEIVRRYVELRPSSGGRWMGPCPFHQETKGSFSVNQDLGFYYCFGCQATGDVIDFYGRVNGLEFRDAVEALASESGLQLKTLTPDPQADARKKLKTACLDMHRLSQEYFRSVINRASGKVVRDYISGRKASPELVETFGLGAATDDWEGLKKHLAAKGYADEQAVTAGLLSKNDAGRIYDRFRGRLIFPIQDLAGKVIAFGGRIVDPNDKDAPKYLNSADSPIYKKGEHLYGLFQARPQMARSRRALLTEGYMDVLTLHQFGFTDAVGVLGTALTPEQVKRLAGFCKRVELVFDGDAPGRKAALRSAEMILAQGLACSVVLLPGGQDVDDLLKAEGRAGFETCLAEAVDGLDFCMGEIAATGSAREVMEWARGFLSSVREKDWLAWYLPRLCDGLGLDEATLRRGTMAVVKSPGSAKQGARDSSGTARRADEWSVADRELLRFIVQHPECWKEFQECDYDLVLESEQGQKLWDKISECGENCLQTVFHLLNEDEKLFVAQSVELPQNRESKYVQQWHQVANGIIRNLYQQRMRDIQMAQNDAQRRGDNDEVLRLEQSLNDCLKVMGGRLNEQS